MSENNKKRSKPERKSNQDDQCNDETNAIATECGRKESISISYIVSSQKTYDFKDVARW